MEWGYILTIIISGVGLLWTIYRDNTSDMEKLENRLTALESTVNGNVSAIDRLVEDHDELEGTIRNLQDKIHKMDLKIERILTILEK